MTVLPQIILHFFSYFKYWKHNKGVLQHCIAAVWLGRASNLNNLLQPRLYQMSALAGPECILAGFGQFLAAFAGCHSR